MHHWQCLHDPEPGSALWEITAHVEITSDPNVEILSTCKRLVLFLVKWQELSYYMFFSEKVDYILHRHRPVSYTHLDVYKRQVDAKRHYVGNLSISVGNLLQAAKKRQRIKTQ